MKNKHLFLIIIWACLAIVSRSFKFSIPIGEQSATFSCFVAVLPIIAYFFPSRIYLIGLFWFLTHLIHPIPLTAGIPTLLATLSWKASNNRGISNLWMHFALPLLAIFLFIFSPNGKEAWPYALYWFIPIVCAFGQPNLLKRALQSTFVAHAAGSIMWAYLTPIASFQWLALIPIVALERATTTLFAIVVIKALSPLFIQCFAVKKVKNPTTPLFTEH